jgi:ribosome biogenesis GTPase
VHVLERATCFARRRVLDSSQEQVIAANVDLTVVVAAFSPADAGASALHHGINQRRLERYLWAVAESGSRALVALNKADLSLDPGAVRSALEDALGVPVLAVSAADGSGLPSLLEHLSSGETLALVGSSGTGKSSLVNRLLGRSAQRVVAIREADARGHHTTTGRQLFELPGGGFIIDTPGMRELGLLAEPDGEAAFDEIEQVGEGCRFRDCRHEGEPGCAVLLAVESGAIDAGRLQHSHKLRRETEWQQQRKDARLRGNSKRKFRELSRAVRASLIRKGRGD